MRRTRRGITLSELLTVVAAMTILASMLAPILLRGQKEAVRQFCLSNMTQIYRGAQLIANKNFGTLPACFDLVAGDPNTDRAVNEESWWYLKVWKILYPGRANYLDSNDSKDPFRVEQCVVRCPASRDPADQTHSRRTGSTVDGNELDKDRVYDDSYGYNNYGFLYVSDPALANPDTLGPQNLGCTGLYHGGGTISGKWDETNPLTTHIGAFADVPRAPSTILLIDYIKADAQPFPNTNEGIYGYRFRHGGRANVLFVDGHVLAYTKRNLLTDVDRETIFAKSSSAHWKVYRP